MRPGPNRGMIVYARGAPRRQLQQRCERWGVRPQLEQRAVELELQHRVSRRQNQIFYQPDGRDNDPERSAECFGIMILTAR